MGIRIWTLEDKEVRVVKTRFDNARANDHWRGGSDFEIYLELFQTTMTCTEIGLHRGKTKQAVHLTYQNYFEEFLGPWAERMTRHRELVAALEQELLLKQKLDEAYASPTFLYLQEQAEAYGKSVTPVVDFRDTPIIPGHTPVYRIGEDRFLRLHRRTKPFYPSYDKKQRYGAFQVSLNMLTGIHAYGMLADMPGMEREHYLVMPDLLRQKFQGVGGTERTEYIAVGDYHPRKRRGREDLKQYKDAWWIFDL